MVNNWLKFIQYKLFPPTCIVCDQAGFENKDICTACYADLMLNTCHCRLCAMPLTAKTDHMQLCGQCLKKTPRYQQVSAPFLYQHSIRWLITGLKFHRQVKNARLLGQLFVDHLPPEHPLPDFIVPVPLHPKRYRQRGFNQSQEIATTVARQLEIPLHPNLCRRIKYTQQQSLLHAKQRHKNIRNAFSVSAFPQGSNIVIFDDVMTTGATASELVKVLKQAGAGHVWIWVCARA